MRVETLFKFILLLSLVSCKPMKLNSPLEAPTPSLTLSPIPTVPTGTLTITPQSTSIVTPNARNLADYYGVWTITRYEHPRMSIAPTDAYAESQIGKTMELTKTEMRFDKDFLWLSNKYCANASYDWATVDEFVGSGWQALLPFENPEKREDLLFLNVNCNGKMVTGFEVSKTGKLVVYYDGYWFFFDPETSAASALATRFATTYTPTSTPSPLPRFTATYTASLAPTQFYEEYFYDWLIDQEAETHQDNIVQTGSHPLFASEKYPVAPDSYLDLDNSIYTEGKSDLKFSFVNDVTPNYQLLPVNGTKVISVDFSRAALETCIEADYSSVLNFISIEAEQGNYFCAITSDQRFSLFHIDEVNHLGDGSLRLSFVTHKKDTDE